MSVSFFHPQTGLPALQPLSGVPRRPVARRLFTDHHTHSPSFVAQKLPTRFSREIPKEPSLANPRRPYPVSAAQMRGSLGGAPAVSRIPMQPILQKPPSFIPPPSAPPPAEEVAALRVAPRRGSPPPIVGSDPRPRNVGPRLAPAAAVFPTAVALPSRARSLDGRCRLPPPRWRHPGSSPSSPPPPGPAAPASPYSPPPSTMVPRSRSFTPSESRPQTRPPKIDRTTPATARPHSGRLPPDSRAHPPPPRSQRPAPRKGLSRTSRLTSSPPPR
jgi:hypothetical protein